jgi:hypothetical protein
VTEQPQEPHPKAEESPPEAGIEPWQPPEPAPDSWQVSHSSPEGQPNITGSAPQEGVSGDPAVGEPTEAVTPDVAPAEELQTESVASAPPEPEPTEPEPVPPVAQAAPDPQPAAWSATETSGSEDRVLTAKDLATAISGLAARRPELVIGGAFLTGLLAAAIIKRLAR